MMIRMMISLVFVLHYCSFCLCRDCYHRQFKYKLLKIQKSLNIDSIDACHVIVESMNLKHLSCHVMIQK